MKQYIRMFLRNCIAIVNGLIIFEEKPLSANAAVVCSLNYISTIHSL